MEITTQSLASVKRGLQKLFDKSYQGIADPWWKLLALLTTSTGADEEYHWLGAIPGLRELVGEITVKNLLRHGYTIKNKEWEDTIGIKRKDIERDALGVYDPLIAAMAEQAAYQPGELVAQLLVNGFTDTDYTGSAFFASGKKAHAKATAFSNVGTKKLSQANYRIGRSNLVGRLNAEGKAMRLGVNLQLVVSPTYESTAKEITTAERLANGGTNIDRGTATVMVLPELLALGAEHAWFLIEAGKSMKPLIVQTEKLPTTAMVTNPDDSHVVKNQEFIYQVYARHNAGYGLPEFAYGNDGSAAA